MKRFWLYLIAPLILFGCNTTQNDDSQGGGAKLPTLSASIEQDAIEQSDISFSWESGDLISVFYGTTLNSQYRFDSKKGGSFKYVSNYAYEISDQLDGIYAIYPYREEMVANEDGTIICSLPAVQEYAAGGVAKSSNTMVAAMAGAKTVAAAADADDALIFKNTCGYIKVNLYGNATVKSVKISGNNSEKIAGSATITAPFDAAPRISVAEEATSSIFLDCGDGVKLNGSAGKATEFWFAVPPTEFSQGIKIVVTNTDELVFIHSIADAITVKRNETYSTEPIKVEFVGDYTNEHHPSTIPDTEIWYTTTDGSMMSLPRDVASAFGANLVKHTYDDEKGVIEFDAPVTKIGKNALSYYKLASITLPYCVTAIEETALSGTAIKSIYIPNSVTTLGKGAFKSCKSLTSATFGNGVTEIGDEAFYYCNNLTNIKFNEKITSIGAYAFYRCFALRSIVIPNSVTAIKEYAFSECKDMVSLKMSKNLVTIGDYAFSRCSSLGVINIPDGVEYIGEYAFYLCENAVSIEIPNSVKDIEQFAFGSCTNINHVTIPNSITTLKWHLFADCSALTTVTIPNGIKTIEWGVFSNCKSLTHVTLPASIQEIGPYAFLYCQRLSKVLCLRKSPPTGDYQMFYGNKANRKIYVPQNSVNAYKSASYWSDYKDDIVGDDIGEDDDSGNGGSGNGGGMGGMDTPPSVGDGATIK